MVNLSVCIEMYWRNEEVPFAERMRRVAALGFEAYEFWGWKEKDLDAMRAAQSATGMTLAALALEPGFAVVDPYNEDEIVEGVALTAAVAHTFDCQRIIVTTGDALYDESYEITRRRVIRKLRKMAAVAEAENVILCLEPLNPLVDHRGYWLTTMAQASDIVDEVDSPALTILYDLYHQQITEGNLIANLRRYGHQVGHIHTAGVPGRHELLGSENDYRALFAAIDQFGYEGYVGLEYRPTIDVAIGLRQAQDLAQEADEFNLSG